MYKIGDDRLSAMNRDAKDPLRAWHWSLTVVVLAIIAMVAVLVWAAYEVLVPRS